MALSPLAQGPRLVARDPYIRDGVSDVVEPGYIRDSDLESAFVRYPKAGGRLVEKGVGALMEDPLGLITGALSGVVDQARESGDPLSFLQDSATSLGLPIVESGKRLAGGDYGGMTQEEEEEARILDALTVAELIPMVGMGIKAAFGPMRRRLRIENPEMDDAEIESIMAQVVKPGSGIPKIDMIEGSPAGLYNQTVTQSAVDLINGPPFGEGFAERLQEVAAENSIAVGDRTFMPMNVYTELADRVNNPDFRVVDRSAPVSQDLEFIRAVDRPDIVKDIFLDDEYAADVLGSLRNADLDIPDAAPIADVQKVRVELYRLTQDKFADLPDEITVYRAGDLNERDGISSFTLNPNYNPDLDLPWNDLRGSPKLEAYTVKKSDILASPDLIRDFGEGEVIIRNSSVVRAADRTVTRYEKGGSVMSDREASGVSLFDLLQQDSEEKRKADLEWSIRRNEERIARDAAREYEVMKQVLDNTKADMLARAYANAEDEYLVGMTPTNPNPFFEMAVSGGRHRGMFGSYPTRPVETIRETGRDGKPVEIDFAGYTYRGGKPFLANYVPSYRDRLADSPISERPRLEDENISSPIDYGDLYQQRLRPVFTDPYLATPEILAHEAAHIGEVEFIRENMDVFRPLMEERGTGAYDTAEFLVELFEPPAADEKFTDSSVTDAERIAAQAYFRTGELDTKVLGPALSALLVRLRGSVGKYATGGRVSMGLGSMKKEVL